MTPALLRDERLLDLLVKQATEGITIEEQAEMERLLAAHPGADREEIARVAASLALVGVEEEPMPAQLRDRVRADAALWITRREAKVADLGAKREAQREPVVREVPVRGRSSPWPWLATAASLLVAIGAWYWRPGADMQQVQAPPPAPEPVTPSQEREHLLAHGAGVINAPWTNTEDPASAGVTGDVVWDNAAQKGYLRFTGLAPNDPGKFQYQLWIFDAKQDERYPIDGGVFDVPAGTTEVVVPIDPKIAVAQPVMFAVTIEKPGGVVVSGREHIVALAKAAAAG